MNTVGDIDSAKDAARTTTSLMAVVTALTLPWAHATVESDRGDRTTTSNDAVESVAIKAHDTTSHHIAPHRTTSHHITPHRTTSHHIAPHHATAHHTTPQQMSTGPLCTRGLAPRHTCDNYVGEHQKGNKAESGHHGVLLAPAVQAGTRPCAVAREHFAQRGADWQQQDRSRQQQL
jgi:hypothetical protein